MVVRENLDRKKKRKKKKKKRETAILIQEIFSEDLKDYSFSDWLSDELGSNSNIIFCDFLEYGSKNSSQTGRKDHKLNDQIALKVYEFWKDYSTVSVDRGNERNVIKSQKTKYTPCAKVLLIHVYLS